MVVDIKQHKSQFTNSNITITQCQKNFADCVMVKFEFVNCDLCCFIYDASNVGRTNTDTERKKAEGKEKKRRGRDRKGKGNVEGEKKETGKGESEGEEKGKGR